MLICMCTNLVKFLLNGDIIRLKHTKLQHANGDKTCLRVANIVCDTHTKQEIS